MVRLFSLVKSSQHTDGFSFSSVFSRVGDAGKRTEVLCVGHPLAEFECGRIDKVQWLEARMTYDVDKVGHGGRVVVVTFPIQHQLARVQAHPLSVMCRWLLLSV